MHGGDSPRSRGSVRFAEERAPTPPAAAAAAATVECKLGFLLAGGIYSSDLLQLEEPQTAAAAAIAAAGQPQPQLQALGLAAPNVSVSLEHGGHVVLRLWADREGPFEAAFTLVLPPHGQEVEVHVSATVFSPKKGHPALKPHVRCLGFAADADTEAASDWRGFE